MSCRDEDTESDQEGLQCLEYAGLSTRVETPKQSDFISAWSWLETFPMVSKLQLLRLYKAKSRTEIPHRSVGKESAYNAGDLGSIPELGRSPEEGNNNPLQFSCLENPMDRGIWWATVQGVTRVGHNLVTKEKV